jgi:hypothetical protein
MILRVLPYWPRDRHLEFAPEYWRATRDQLLRPEELAAAISAFEALPPPPRGDHLGICGERVDVEPIQPSFGRRPLRRVRPVERPQVRVAGRQRPA